MRWLCEPKSRSYGRVYYMDVIIEYTNVCVCCIHYICPTFTFEKRRTLLCGNSGTQLMFNACCVPTSNTDFKLVVFGSGTPFTPHEKKKTRTIRKYSKNNTSNTTTTTAAPCK